MPEAEHGQAKRSLIATEPLQILDDRESVQPGDQVLLIFAGDARSARRLLAAAHKTGLKAITTTRGADARELAERFNPAAITLDLDLADIDGWSALEQFKGNLTTRHIPVQIISSDDDRARGLRCGAFAYLVKPVTPEGIEQALAGLMHFAQRETRSLLVVGSDEGYGACIPDLIGDDAVQIEVTGSAADALKRLKIKNYDCMVLNSKLPDASGIKFLETLQNSDPTRELPVIVYGTEALTQLERERLRTLLGKSVIKEVQSPERMLDEMAMFLHLAVFKLPAPQRRMLERLYEGWTSLEGKQALVVDDDVRNIFALTSVLESNKMLVTSAENGRTAIELLKQLPDIDIVLMDIMMPEMDGLETMRQIRTMKKHATLPMIALTAKALKGDRKSVSKQEHLTMSASRWIPSNCCR